MTIAEDHRFQAPPHSQQPPNGSAPSAEELAARQLEEAIHRLEADFRDLQGQLSPLKAEARTLGGSALDYLRAQGALLRFRAQETARLAALRGALGIVLAMCLLIAWSFAIVALWQGTAALFPELPILQPMAVMGLHLLAAAILTFLIKRLKL
ncbi:MAG: hypothetical protein RLY93_01485 [Sumerlaeia bacterium]